MLKPTKGCKATYTRPTTADFGTECFMLHIDLKAFTDASP